jgi:hypothetical protein
MRCVDVWCREGQDRANVLSVGGQHFLGVGIISEVVSSYDHTWDLPYILLRGDTNRRGLEAYKAHCLIRQFHAQSSEQYLKFGS